MVKHTMRLFNTLSRRVETFEPQDAHKVRVYVCGITPYDSTHLGHALTYVTSDVLIRFLRHLGYRIQYVQNLTDIDDAILRAAGERDADWRELGETWTEHYIQDMKTLNVSPPDHFPRATAHIPQMHEVIGTLLDEGVAYQSGGGVYFHVNAWEEFGKLSRLERGEMLPMANEGGNDPDDPRKRDPLDFPLWKPEEPNEPSWESPWGRGRPGWHIECSTMASHYLGETIDIHGGGDDLVFPHHEGEVAQSECATHTLFSRFWFHTAMLRHQGRKMSKSVGNLVMARDLLESFSPDALRLYLCRYHYRESREHDRDELVDAEALADTLRRGAEAVGGFEGGEGGQDEEEEARAFHTLDPGPEEEALVGRLEDDLDTPAALDILEVLAERILEAAASGQAVSRARERLRALGKGLFGLRLDDDEPQAEVLEGWERHRRSGRQAGGTS